MPPDFLFVVYLRKWIDQVSFYPNSVSRLTSYIYYIRWKAESASCTTTSLLYCNLFKELFFVCSAELYDCLSQRLFSKADAKVRGFSFPSKLSTKKVLKNIKVFFCLTKCRFGGGNTPFIIIREGLWILSLALGISIGALQNLHWALRNLHWSLRNCLWALRIFLWIWKYSLPWIGVWGLLTLLELENQSPTLSRKQKHKVV